MVKRNTKSKQAVINCFKSHKFGLKPDDLIGQLAQYDKVTIYRILQSFLDDGILHRAISEDGSSYYFICQTCKEVHFHNHYHFKCSKCGKVECINEEIEIKLPKKYSSTNINFWITGICADCK